MATDKIETARAFLCNIGPWSDEVGIHSLTFYSPRAVTDSINQLITMCTQQAPGQKECDNALRELEVGTWQAKWG